MPGLPAGVCKTRKLGFMERDDIFRIIRPQRGQHLDAVIDRPFCKAASKVRTFFEGKREHAGLLDRASNPDIMARGGVKRRPAKPVIDKNAEPFPVSGKLGHRGQRKRLEMVYIRVASPVRSGHITELRAVVEGECQKLIKPPAPRGRPVDLLECLVPAKRKMIASRLDHMP